MEKSVKHYLEELDAQDEKEASDEHQASSEAGKEAKAFEVDKLAALLEKKRNLKQSLTECKRVVKTRLL